MTDKSFLEGLAARPDDDDLRLVYADWLEERGDLRGAFLRAVVAVGKQPAGSPSLPGLYRGLLELRPRVSTEWVARACRSLAADEVREAVVRNLLEGITRCSLAFLLVEGENNPSWYLSNRLAESPPHPDRPIRFKPQSSLRRPDEEVEDEEECEDEDGEGRPLIDRDTGERGVFLEISELRWTGEDQCEVQAGICEDADTGVYSLYKVALQDGRWAITESSIVWAA